MSPFTKTEQRVSLSSKVKAEHLDGYAALYVRQSTTHQLKQHQESTERQYALKDRLNSLGWSQSQTFVIDDDLGRSGTGREERPGFERLLKLITERKVTLVIGLEMSRLARNSKDWHDLFELCALHNCLIADEDGVFDPNEPNDRLVLGLKGIISELELHTMQVRLERGRINKAQRGELFHSVPVGYVKNDAGLPELDPDESARHVVRMFFELFTKLGSSNKLFHHLAEHQVKLPFRSADGRVIQWRVPAKTTVYAMLKHPLYAGAYGYGRRKNYKRKDTQKARRKHLPPEQWKVLLKDQHPAYISWNQFQQNQKQLEQNDVRGDRSAPARGDTALLGGMIRCGHCGRRMSPLYNASGSVTYACSRHRTVAGAASCQNSIGNAVLDQLIGQRIVDVLEPCSVQLSLQVIEDERTRREHLETLYLQQLEKARYDSDLAARRYQQVEPANRLVARTLEADWETALAQQDLATQRLSDFRAQHAVKLDPAEREQMLYAASDVRELWQTKATRQQRQQITRLLISKVTVTVGDNRNRASVGIHWHGGFESFHEIMRPVSRYKELEQCDELLKRILELAKLGQRSTQIAAQLELEGFTSPRTLQPISAAMVRKLSSENEHLRRALHEPTLGNDHWLVESLATRLGVRAKRLKDWVSRGWITAIQRPFGRTWVLYADDAEISRLKRLICSQTGQGKPRPPKELRTPKPLTR